jgi:tRNA uridine 5-carboxymethylaminomethyl modification enzyme
MRLGIYSDLELDTVTRRLEQEDAALRLAETTSISPQDAARVLTDAGSAPLAQSIRIAEVAKRQDVFLGSLFDAAGLDVEFDPEALITADLEIKYAGYFARERTQAERMRRMGDFSLDTDLVYEEMRSLSFEARQKLSRLKPSSLAQASRIPGVSPSDLQNLVIEVERRRRLATAP